MNISGLQESILAMLMNCEAGYAEMARDLLDVLDSTLARMQERGLIEREQAPETIHRPHGIYQITELGREQLKFIRKK